MEWKTGTVLDDLIGREIQFVRVSDTVLLVVASDLPCAVEVEGDCCSTSWWADITGVPQIVGRAVTAIEDLDLSGYDVNDGRGRQEEDQAYGFRIRCGESFADFIYRNSSNGYYGGWMQTYRVDALPSGMEIVDADWKSTFSEA